MSLAILFHFLCAQHVSDINIIHHQELATMLLNYHIGCVVLGSMCVGVSVWLGWSGICVAGFSLQHRYRVHGIWWRRGVAPVILKLDSRSRWVVCIALEPLSLGQSTPVPLNKRLGGSHLRFRHFGEGNLFCLCRNSNLWPSRQEASHCTDRAIAARYRRQRKQDPKDTANTWGRTPDVSPSCWRREITWVDTTNVANLLCGRVSCSGGLVSCVLGAWDRVDECGLSRPLFHTVVSITCCFSVVTQ
jgi:hypothetical protein